MVDCSLVEQLVGGAGARGIAIDREGGLLTELTKLVVESALEGEMTAHVGYEKHERAGEGGAGNVRNGTREKTVLTKAGPDVGLSPLRPTAWDQFKARGSCVVLLGHHRLGQSRWLGLLDVAFEQFGKHRHVRSVMETAGS